MSDREEIPTSGGTRRPPAIKLAKVGDYVDAAIIDRDPAAPAYVFGTSERAKTQDGKDKTKDIVTVLVIRGSGVVKDSTTETERPVEPGEVCTIHIEGQTRWDPDADKVKAKGDFKSWSGALKDHGTIARGDVLRWHFESEVPGKGAQPRKVRLFKIRQYKPEEAAQAERCKQLHRDSQAVPVGASDYTDEEPF